MFKRPGLLLKKLALGSFLVESIGAFITGIILAIEVEEFWLFLVISIGGILFAWLSALFLFAFGHLVDNSEKAVVLLKGEKIDKLEADDTYPVFSEGSFTSSSQYKDSFLSKLSNIDSVNKPPIGMKHCNNCKNLIPIHANFCEFCGANINASTPKNTPFPQGWTCPNCKTEHPSYVGSCGCGQAKPQ